MANSIKTYVWNSSTHSNTSDFIAPTPISGRGSTDIKVKVGSTILTSGYTLTVDSSNVAKVRFQTLPNNGDPIRIYRETKHDGRLVDFVDGSLLTSETLDLDSTQLFNMAQEAYDKSEETTIGRESFYYSQGTDPTSDAANIVNTGALWYDTSSSTNTLQVWSGTEWQATAPAKVKKAYQRVNMVGFLQVVNDAHSAGKTKFADTAFKTHSSLYLNGVKLVEASTLADIPTKGDYFLSGGDVILLNLSSDTDVLVSETFDGSFSSSVTASEANAAASQQSAAQSAFGAVQNSQAAGDYKDEAKDARDDAAKYASNPKGSTFSTHDNSATGQYSAKHYAETAADSATTASSAANNTQVQTVGTDLALGNNSKIKKVSDDIADVTAVAGKINEVDTVAGMSSNITSVLADASDIGSVASNISNVNTVASLQSDINTVAGISTTDLQKVAAVDGDVQDVANIKDDVTDVANIAANVTSVAGDAADIGTVANAINNVNTVASIEGDVSTVANSTYKSKVETVADSTYKTKVEAVASDINDIAAVADKANDIGTLNTGNHLQNIADAVTNINAINNASTNASTATAQAALATQAKTDAEDAEAGALASKTAAQNSASSALASQQAAASSETDAQTAQALAESANTLAQGAKDTAVQKASEAQESANAAGTSQGNAQANMNVAIARADSAHASQQASSAWSSLYQSLYLGAQSSAPSTDLGGNALVEGALYFNSSNDTMYVYDGGQWVAAQSTINTTTTTNLTQDLNTNNFNIDLTDDDEIRFGNNDQVLMAGRSYGGEISVDNNNLKLFINANIDSGHNDTSGRHFIKGFMVNSSDEDGGILDPRISNELAGAHKWATVTYTNMYSNTERANLLSSDTGAPFDATSSHSSVYLPVGQEGTMEIDFNGVAILTYGTWVGVSFGNTGTRCNRVKIEVYRDGGWQTIRDVTDNPHSQLCNYVHGNNAQGVTKIKYTFGDQVNAGGSGYFRLHTVFASNYQSGSANGGKGLHYPQRYFNSQMYADTTWRDGYKAKFGTDGDLQIHHSGSNSFIDDTGTGNLVLKSNGLKYQTTDGSTRITAQDSYTDFNHDVHVRKTGGSNNNTLVLSGYDTNNHNDIGTLTGGSGFGGLIEGGNNGQMTIGIRNNDVVDGFNIVSGGANPEYTDDLVYDKLAFRVQSNGNTTINGATLINDELKLRGDVATITNYNTGGGAARIEIGGTTSAYLDLKTPYGDDFDLRLLHEAATNLSQINSKSDLKVVVNSIEAMRFDSETGHVGIGATNPAKLLTLSSNDAPTVRLTNLRNDTSWDTDPVFGALEFYSNDGSGAGQGVRACVKAKANDQYGHTTNLAFHTSTSTGNSIERMLIGWDGATTINASSSSGTATLDVKDNTPIIKLTNKDTTLEGGNTIGAIQFKGRDASEDGTDILGAIYCVAHDQSPDAYLSFRTHKNNTGVDDGATERMRIDHEGRIGIGTTSPKQLLHVSGGSSSGDVTKVTIGATGTNAETHLLLAERFTGNSMNYGFSFVTDGNGSNNLLIKNHDNNINGNVAMTVARGDGKVTVHGDLVAEDGIKLGGTGTANKLDDYEEGSWTMRIQESGTLNQSSSTNANCKYTKIGNVVHVQGHILDINNDAFAGTGTLQIAGLPFVQLGANATRPHGSCQINGFSGITVQQGCFVQGQSGTNYALLKFQQQNSGAGTITTSQLNNNDQSDIFFSLTYTTNS